MSEQSSKPNPTAEPLSAEKRRYTFARKQQIMAMFSDNAKVYIQLSGTALGLTLTFAHPILRVPAKENIADGWMIAVWICFLTTIITGAFYQYKAVKLLELEIDWQSSDIWGWLQPG
ncbi:MAG: hypothetical protein ABI197_14710 [Granulicella sp.]